jgi:apolipoprotein N-acyltransferase
VASAADYRRFGLGVVAVASTAVLVWFGTGLHPFWPLLWFAPLPVLLFANRASWLGVTLVAAFAWLLGYLNMWHYFHGMIDIPLSVLVPIYASETVVFVMAVLLYRALLRRGIFWTALLALPATWVSCEYLFNIASPHGTAGSLAYSQLDFLPFLQLASLTGPWGMSFLLLLFPTALAIGFHLRPTAPKQALRVVGASLSVILSVLVFGAVRLELPERGRPVKVGLIASDAPTSPQLADEGAAATKLFQTYADQAAKLAAQGAQVIVLPEKLAVAVDPDTHDMDSVFQSLANRTRARIVVGLIHVSPPLKYNEARVYAPDAPVLSYNKHHMLPAFESKLQPGTTLTLMSETSGTWGVEICKDMDFTRLSREYGQAGAGLMLVPAWDFDLDRIWHGHMALMRGVESGFSIARASKQGYLTVSDDRGRILAETTSDSAPFATLLADVPTTHDSTLYMLLGDWFAWLALVLLGLALVRGTLPQINEARGEAQ